MTNYISSINGYNFGGIIFDSGWMYTDASTYAIFSSKTFTAGQSVTYSLANILPNTPYIYLCQFDCYIRTGSTSGNSATAIIFSGTDTDLTTGLWAQIAGAVTRTSSNRASGGCCILPIFPLDRNITFVNRNTSGTSGSCGLYLKRYKRVGTNA